MAEAPKDEERDGPLCQFVPVLVEPKYQGNIGSVARLCRNFGMKSMVLVNPPELTDEAFAYSMHGKEMLRSARIVSSFDEAAGLFDHMVGTSGISDSAEKCYQRNPITPRELVRWSRRVTGMVGLALGREDFGLFKEELGSCDLLVTIPADPAYPILNLSHAASILFYEIWTDRSGYAPRNARSISGAEKRALLEHYERLMAACSLPEHKRPIARTNFRRMVARAALNYREFNSLMGTFSRAMDYKRKKRIGPGEGV